MVQKEQLQWWVIEALKAHGGRAELLTVAKYIWEKHGEQLKASGDLFFTWQYDMRWAATELRKQGCIKAADSSPKGVWELEGAVPLLC
ncbi:hypothetical protein [Chromobacterium haemolyticum]|uniref:Restriction system protein Mrr-like N-terminal domain-containing protein n=1 Tax=Chromobacterium haemolyticum TaxID=394935 RepID=A0A1W0CZ05_9NEIS|nr:hypothetical protein [Chromobacterium haemolyticum]OQS39964.1 hypothetical protein B0T45_11425 [Chromobacterium haemolyticum]